MYELLTITYVSSNMTEFNSFGMRSIMNEFTIIA